MRTLALVVASAFGGALAFAMCLAAFFLYFSPGIRYSTGTHVGEPGGHAPSESTVLEAPPIKESKRFLGSTGSYNGDFDTRNVDKVLATGPGEIAGTITANGKPVPGVRIRLALNGAVMSQWGETGNDGKYHVAVPLGTYRIDGYTLDHRNLDEVLAGKTENRRCGCSMEMHDKQTIQVVAGRPASGLSLEYVDPVQLTGPSGDLPLAGPVVISWKPYAGAASYRIQLTEMKTPGDFMNREFVFAWRARPVVKETSIDLAKAGADLHAGSFYQADIEALDPSGRVMANTGNRFRDTDFHVVN